MANIELRKFFWKFLTDEDFRSDVERGSENIFEGFKITDEEKRIISKGAPEISHLVASCIQEELPDPTGDVKRDQTLKVGIIRGFIKVSNVNPTTSMIAVVGTDEEAKSKEEIEAALEEVHNAIAAERYEKILDLIKLIDG